MDLREDPAAVPKVCSASQSASYPSRSPVVKCGQAQPLSSRSRPAPALYALSFH